MKISTHSTHIFTQNCNKTENIIFFKHVIKSNALLKHRLHLLLLSFRQKKISKYLFSFVLQ